jgi:hypothetical protein
MALTDVAELRERLDAALSRNGAEGENLEDLVTEGYAHALALDAERMKLERGITELAARAEDPAAAQELRKLWLRHRTMRQQLSELRSMLAELKRARA